MTRPASPQAKLSLGWSSLQRWSQCFLLSHNEQCDMDIWCLHVILGKPQATVGTNPAVNATASLANYLARAARAAVMSLMDGSKTLSITWMTDKPAYTSGTMTLAGLPLFPGPATVMLPLYVAK
jgi:hypothetical protein